MQWNIHEGIKAQDDILPRRFSKEPIPEGSAKDQVVSEEVLEQAKTECHNLRGWDSNGIPKK